MKNYFLILFTLLFFSCGEKKEEIPSDVLTKEKYISVMIDMYLLESKYSHANLIDRPNFDKGIKEYEAIFKKHGTDKKEVEKSIDFYSHHPKEMQEIQSRILDSLNLKTQKN